MVPIKSEFARQLAKLLRENLRLRADLETAERILDTLESTGLAPHKWQETRQQMLDLPGTPLLSEEYEQLFLQLERAADIHEIEEVFARMPSAQLPN